MNIKLDVNVKNNSTANIKSEIVNKDIDLNKKKAVELAIASIQKMYGKAAIISMGSNEVVQDIEVISTGSLALDIALGVGGLPRGRICEIYGPESSGKTTIALSLIAQAQKDQNANCAIIDTEHALDRLYAQKLGVNLNRMHISQPQTAEEALDIMDKLVRSAAFDVVVLDSVAALVPQAESEGNMGDHQMASQARLMSQALRKLTASIAQSKCVVLFVNQLRHKIGVMFGSPETTTGGNALKFYCSVRIDIRRIATIKDKEIPIGNEVKIKIAKNKVGVPFQTVTTKIMFGKGIDTMSEIIDLGVIAKVIDKSGSWYSIGNEKIGQGKDSVKDYLIANPQFNEQLIQSIKLFYKNNRNIDEMQTNNDKHEMNKNEINTNVENVEVE